MIPYLRNAHQRENLRPEQTSNYMKGVFWTCYFGIKDNESVFTLSTFSLRISSSFLSSCHWAMELIPQQNILELQWITLLHKQQRYSPPHIILERKGGSTCSTCKVPPLSTFCLSLCLTYTYTYTHKLLPVTDYYFTRSGLAT